MRTIHQYCLRIAVLGGAICCFAANDATAAESIEADLADARRDLEIAKINHRFFWHVERPRTRRDLDAAIRLTQAEVDILGERMRHYRTIDEFRNHRPLLETLQAAEFAQLEAELRLKDLWGERAALRRTFGDRCRLL